ncbi:MAG: alpha/beta hydrolase [Bacteroidetes bacterium]|nr:alpha/beta hydrolase [Bacteroidota bacterium]
MRAIIILFSILGFMNAKAQNTELIQNGNTILNVKVYSRDKTEAIILLHGGPGVPDEMTEIVNILKEEYKVITFEQRGVGLSKCQKCSFTMNDYISDVDIIIKKLNIKEFHLFGHSWGGLYAQIYAKERPDKIKSLFLCSPSSGTNKIWKKTENEVMQFNKNNTSKNEWLKMGWNSLLGMFGSDKAYRKLFKQVLKNYHKNYSKVEIKDEFLNKISSKPINKTRSEIIKYKLLNEFYNPNFPIIITYGKNDIYGESKNELIKRFPTAKVEIIDNCGHIPWKHNPIEFEMILNEFYKKAE